MAYIQGINGRLVVGFKFDGKKRREFLGLDDSKANWKFAERIARDIEHELAAGTFCYWERFPNSKTAQALRPQAPVARKVPTLREFSETCLKEWTHLTPAVAYDYLCVFRTHIWAHDIADRRLDQIHDGHIKALIEELKAKPNTGNRRVNYTISRLRTLFKTALRRRDAAGKALIADDPMAFVDNLREAKPEIDPFDADEAARIIEAARGQDKSFISTLLATGARPNEILALHWGDIDFKKNLIRIRATLHRKIFGGRGLPKTKESERDIAMSATARRALQEQRERTELRGDLVFVNEDGGAVDLSNFRRRNWSGILKRAHVTERTIYQCRHTFATLALENGSSPREVADALGHTSVEMVYRRYARWLPGKNQGATAALDRALAGASK